MSKVFGLSLSGSVLSALILTTAITAPARAAPADYRFDVVTPVEASGRGSTVAVALIHTPSGTRVTNAEVFRRETVLREKGIPRIDERHIPLTPDGQGNYRLTTHYPLSDGTLLQLGARVAGETSPVRSAIRVHRSN